jgi:hypothetical protein
MEDFDEVIFNLFIMAFMYPSYIDFVEEYYEYENLLNESSFTRVKDCFPLNEITLPEINISGYWLETSQINYIREV